MSARDGALLHSIMIRTEVLRYRIIDDRQGLGNGKRNPRISFPCLSKNISYGVVNLGDVIRNWALSEPTSRGGEQIVGAIERLR